MPRRAAVLFVLASVAWGVPYLLAALVVDDLGAPLVVFGRSALAAVVLLPYAIHTGALEPIRGRLRAVTWLALLDLTVPTLLITLGVATIPSSLAGTLVASVPLLVAALAWRFDAAERPTPLRLAGLVVGLTGVALLLGLEVGGSARALAGALLVLGAALCYAGGALFYKRRFADVPAFGVVTAALVASAALSAVPAALTLPDHAPSAGSLLALAALGLGCTAGGYTAFYSLIATIGAGRAAVITYVAPAFAVAGGVLALGEPLTAATVAGLLLVLAGSWLSAGGRGGPGRRRPAIGRRARRPATPAVAPDGRLVPLTR